MSPAGNDYNSHSIGVGGWVIRSDGAVVLVRMGYGPAKGRLMVPGGHADPDEMLDQTAIREVREETGIEAVPRGILMVRQRVEPGQRNLYVVFLMTVTGEPAADPDLTEVTEALWLRPQEMLERDDLQPVTRELATAWVARPRHCLARRELEWQNPDSYRVWAGEPGRPREVGSGC